jgi:phenylalanyl-tRNA synthetase beta chain
MKINLTWLQDYINEPLPDNETLKEKIIFGAFEVEDVETAKNGDTIFDIKTLPDRNHDCLGHYGMAREIAGLLGLTTKDFEFKIHESIQSDIKVSLKTDVCKRYLARKIARITVGPSPEWLVQRLESIGARSINNVVDATNYAMYTTGQPIHAFDYDKIGDGHITVRQAYGGEEMLTLDGKLITLDETITVITNDDLDQPMAIAGVKGGKIAEVTEYTKNIIIEVANFNSVSIRKASKKVGIANDSTKRFENELTPHMCASALHVVTDLISALAGGVPEDPIDEYPNPVPARDILVTTEEINKLLGSNISAEEISEILTRYNYSYESSDGEFKIRIPFERIDLRGSHDITEEIGRVYGYEKIEPIVPILSGSIDENKVFNKILAAQDSLMNQGYQEVMTYSFRKKGDFEVARGPVGKSALRKNLTDGLKEAYELNLQSKDFLQLDVLKLFEIGTVFCADGERIMVGLADTSGVSEVLLEDFDTSPEIRVSDEISSMNLKNVTSFQIWSDYPSMTRDVAVWVPQDTDAETVANMIKKESGKLLVCGPRLFDTFSKDGRMSLAYRIVFQSFERTLTDEELNPIMEKIYSALNNKGFEIR